jgi:glycosyltransferase involved in cell wall biosynthesis
MSVSAIIPAFNEAENIALVVSGLAALIDDRGRPLIQEIIVADNNSSDSTSVIARASGARVIFVAEKGYGNACFEACKVAQADVLLFVDGDHTSDLSQVKSLLQAIDSGALLAIGARKTVFAKSLTVAQKFGNAFACFLIRSIWHAPVTDLGPLRAIDRSAYERINMKDRAFGWTIEMQIRAIQLQLKIVEVPISWFPRHAGKSKVSGTVSGVIGAGWGILSMIAKLKWQEIQRSPSRTLPASSRPINLVVRSVKPSPKET